MQHLGVNFGRIWRFELFSLSGFLFFLLQKFALIFNSPVTARGNGVNAHRPRAACGRVQCSANAIIYPFKSAIMWRIQTPHLVQLMNSVSNYIFDCNNRDANTAFFTFRENTAPVTTTGLGLINAKFTFKGTSPPIIFARTVRPINALQLCRWQFSQKKIIRRYKRK